MSLETEEFQKTLRQLGLKYDENNIADQFQLKQLIFSYVGYPDKQKAKIHHRSNNIGKNDLISQQRQNEYLVIDKANKQLAVCQCCGVLANNDKIPYCTSFNQLNIGLGVHMFFKNYIFHAAIFFLLFCIYSLFALITNIQSFNQRNLTSLSCIISDSPQNKCGLSQIGGGSKVLYQNQNLNRLSQIQSWIGVGFVTLWGILYIAKTYFEQKFVVQIQQKRVNASDFTLMLNHIPHSYFVKRVIGNQNYRTNGIQSYGKYEQKKEKIYQYLNESQLLAKFQQQFKNYQNKQKIKINSKLDYQVIKVNVAKPLYQKNQEYMQRQKKIMKSLNQKLEIFRGYIQQRRNNVKFITSDDTRNKKYDNFDLFYSKQLENLPSKEVSYAQDNVVFITMKHSGALKEIVEQNQPKSILKFWKLCQQSQFPIKGVKVRKAPHPYQIKWNSIGFPLQKKRLRRFLVWVFTFILIGISLGISIGIAFINRDSINIGVSIGISIVVSIINIGMQIMIAYLSYYENQYIESRQQTSIALKIAFSQLVNSIGVPIIVTLISQSTTQMKQKSWLRSGGLVDDVFFISLINIIVPLALFFDPWQRYLQLKRWWYSRPNNRIYIYQQKQFNKLYGNYTFDIGYEYAYLIKTAIFTAFFVCTQPIIAIFAPAGLIIYYFATKRNLFYHFQRPKYHFDTINKVVDILLLFSLLAFGFGCLFVNNFIGRQLNYQQNGTLLINWIIVMIAVLFLVIVPLRIFYYCMPRPQKDLIQMDYLQKKKFLFTDFDRLNPLTKDNAIAQFKTYLQDEQKKNQPNNQQAKAVSLATQLEVRQMQREKEAINMRASRMSNIRSSNKKLDEIPQPKYNTNIQEYQEYARTHKEKQKDSTQNRLNQIQQASERSDQKFQDLAGKQSTDYLAVPSSSPQYIAKKSRLGLR